MAVCRIHAKPELNDRKVNAIPLFLKEGIIGFGVDIFDQNKSLKLKVETLLNETRAADLTPDNVPCRYDLVWTRDVDTEHLYLGEVKDLEWHVKKDDPEYHAHNIISYCRCPLIEVTDEDVRKSEVDASAHDFYVNYRQRIFKNRQVLQDFDDNDVFARETKRIWEEIQMRINKKKHR